jgi:hypothetical protein
MTDWYALAMALDRTMAAHVPEWTERSDHDPGVTALEIAAYLAEGLRIDHGAIEGGASAAARIVDALDIYDDREPIVVRVNGERWQRAPDGSGEVSDGRTFVLDEDTGTVTFGDGGRGRVPEPGSTISTRYRSGEGNTSITIRSMWPLRALEYRVSLREEGAVQMCVHTTVGESWSGSKRPRYFSGRLLTANDLSEEQQYHVAKHRRHLQTLHGTGIVSGLEVQVAPGTTTIMVSPGLAVDEQGREVQLEESRPVVVPASTSSPVCLAVEYTERGVDPVPTMASGAEEFTRVEEGCRLVLATHPCITGVTIARLIRDQNTWRVDPAFVPLRTR